MKNKRYDLSHIMTRAWEIFRKAAKKAAISFGEALHRAWESAKSKAENARRIEEARIMAGESQECLTWAGWKAAGFEVKHGEHCRFQVTLLNPSKGDGKTYLASFFSFDGARFKSFGIESDGRPKGRLEIPRGDFNLQVQPIEAAQAA